MARQVNGQLKGAQGKVGDVTYYAMNGQTYARKASTQQVNPRSEAQMNRRVRLANVVAMYRAGAGWMRKAFQTKLAAQSDYNSFVQQNFNGSRVCLTRSDVELGACVVAPYIVTRGTLPSIRVTQLSDRWATDIRLGNLSLTTTTTVAQLTRAILDNNAVFRDGDQLSFISYQQGRNEVTNIPYVTTASYELTLSLSDTRFVSQFLPPFCCSRVSNGTAYFIGTGTDVSAGGFVYVLSRNTRRGIEVSTQVIIMTSTAVLDEYTSTAKYEAAVASYGTTSQIFLNPESTKETINPGADTSVTAMGLGLASQSRALVNKSPAYYIAHAASIGSLFSGGVIMGLKFSSAVTISRVALIPHSGTTIVSSTIAADADNSSSTDKVYYATFPTSVKTSQDWIQRILISMSDGSSQNITGFPAPY